jgi:CheY-like chemotaxis protein
MNPPKLHTARILLLDDDPFMLKILRHQLAQLSYTQVEAFDSGEKALEQLNSSKALYDLIFLDINMPNMDGIEFIRRLVECQYSGSVILVSGEASRILESVEKLIEAHRLTALGHLQKPVNPTRLVSLISRFKAQHRHSGITSASANIRTAWNNCVPPSITGNWSTTISRRWRLATGEVVGAWRAWCVGSIQWTA